ACPRHGSSAIVNDPRLGHAWVMDQRTIAGTSGLSRTPHAYDSRGEILGASESQSLQTSFFGSSPASVGGHRPGRGGHSPPTVSIASPIKASGDLNPNAIRVSRRILVLTDSTSPLDRPSVSAAWM